MRGQGETGESERNGGTGGIRENVRWLKYHKNERVKCRDGRDTRNGEMVNNARNTN